MRLTSTALIAACAIALATPAAFARGGGHRGGHGGGKHHYSRKGRSGSHASGSHAGDPTCYTGPRGGTYTITPSGRKNYSGC